uniref:ERCC4 domain-containing protein n=1 Tax=Ruminococcus bromii TaxID=40518 RepID=UPI004029B48D
MNPFEVSRALKNLTLIVDTREQDTDRLRRRIKQTGLSFVRQKLDFGDYSAKTTLDNGTEFDISSSVSIERKMNLDELCACYCKGRKRFTREFERAKSAGAKVYLLIENASWENTFNGKYRSKMTSSALTASMFAWLARYNCQIIFCKEETSGKIIREILYREMKERLENG